MKSSLILSTILLAGASLSAVAAPAAQTQTQASPDRQIVITDATRYVNVTSGTTVHFVSGDRAFDWTFDTMNGSVAPFDLQKVAPAGLLNHAVTVYVAAGEPYQNG